MSGTGSEQKIDIEEAIAPVNNETAEFQDESTFEELDSGPLSLEEGTKKTRASTHRSSKNAKKKKNKQNANSQRKSRQDAQLSIQLPNPSELQSGPSLENAPSIQTPPSPFATIANGVPQQQTRYSMGDGGSYTQNVKQLFGLVPPQQHPDVIPLNEEEQHLVNVCWPFMMNIAQDIFFQKGTISQILLARVLAAGILLPICSNAIWFLIYFPGAETYETEWENLSFKYAVEQVFIFMVQLFSYATVRRKHGVLQLTQSWQVFKLVGIVIFTYSAIQEMVLPPVTQLTGLLSGLHLTLINMLVLPMQLQNDINAEAMGAKRQRIILLVLQTLLQIEIMFDCLTAGSGLKQGQGWMPWAISILLIPQYVTYVIRFYNPWYRVKWHVFLLSLTCEISEVVILGNAVGNLNERVFSVTALVATVLHNIMEMVMDLVNVQNQDYT